MKGLELEPYRQDNQDIDNHPRATLERYNAECVLQYL